MKHRRCKRMSPRRWKKTCGAATPAATPSADAAIAAGCATVLLPFRGRDPRLMSAAWTLQARCTPPAVQQRPHRQGVGTHAARDSCTRRLMTRDAGGRGWAHTPCLLAGRVRGRRRHAARRLEGWLCAVDGRGTKAPTHAHQAARPRRGPPPVAMEAAWEAARRARPRCWGGRRGRAVRRWWAGATVGAAARGRLVGRRRRRSCGYHGTCVPMQPWW